MKDVEDITEEKVENTLKRAISFHSTLQAHDGHWPGDYGGPMFLLPGLVNIEFCPLCFPVLNLEQIVLFLFCKLIVQFNDLLIVN